MDRRAPATVALVVLVLLAGCSYSQNHVRPEITDVTSVGSIHHVEGVVTQNTHAYNDTSLHDLRVVGYGADGSRACEATLGDVPGDVEPRFAMTCSRFPVVVLVDSDDRKHRGSPHDDPYANFHWHATRYSGYNRSTGHQWVDLMDVGRLGNPPDNVSDYYGTGAFEFVRCRLRVERADVSVLGDPVWADAPPRLPVAVEGYAFTVTPASTPPTAKRAGTVVGTLGRTRLNVSVARALRENESNSYFVDRTAFLEMASLLNGSTVTGLRAMPGPNESEHVRETDTRAETCYEGAGTYHGRLVRTYEFAVDHRPVRGEQPTATVTDRTVVVSLRYEQHWQTMDEEGEQPCRAEGNLSALWRRYCG